ncbi:(S)-ureidoglycine aminohydrolase [Granulicella sibirica]|uniref:Ureidoglycine aminohydrolase n=1 Tax=Granulicella sibirica TaxID=2479048 RepID=A0A4Q0SW40_9BACT|nr:(S)-ureidoglycine aminohydrolase [Granulicella sibirica]RXH55007.1 Ureidoglycine aminohydrolase [Granulicella sibirica]
MHHLGHTRSAHHRDHLLHTPDAFIRTPLPGLEKGMAIVHASPAGGAGFTQYTVELEAGGVLAESGLAGVQRFVYVVYGAVDLASDATFRQLTADGFAYIPPDTAHTITANADAVLQVIEKPFTGVGDVVPPRLFTGNERAVAGVPLAGDEGLEVRALLPADFAQDFAVNTMTYAPGAALSLVEVHVMEHGLMMLAGGGIYRLGEHWYPVTAGDFIWMGPYCPQWFGALGKTPAKYLIYKDFNRHPLA